MQPKRTSLVVSFLLVIGAHVGVLAPVLLASPAPKPVEIVMPTIQGVLVMAEPEVTPPPPEPPPPLPPPEKKPDPKPTPKPPPKAPPSERAVKAPEPEPPPQLPPAEPKPAEPTPAPVVPPRAEAGEPSNPAPPYPKLSNRLREEGTVLLEILIKADGTVGEIKIKKTSGFKRLDTAAVIAVKRWRYQPATQGDKKIDLWYEQPVEFNLR